MSGTQWRVEGFAGSACQQGSVHSPPPLPDDLAVVFVHAINPYGFAWIRRVNEDNVDLNRNCIDFAAGLPGELRLRAARRRAGAPTWDEETQRTSTASTMLEFAAEAGFDRLQAAVSWSVPPSKGILFGGTQPGVVAAHSGESSRVARSPVRDGRGARPPYRSRSLRRGELIASHPDASGRDRGSTRGSRVAPGAQHGRLGLFRRDW